MITIGIIFAIVCAATVWACIAGGKRRDIIVHKRADFGAGK